MTGKHENDQRKNSQNGLRAFHMEGNRCNRGISLILSGIIGINDFSDCHILLLSHGGRISIVGKRLVMNVYECGNVEIIGRVEGIEFKYGKN